MKGHSQSTTVAILIVILLCLEGPRLSTKTFVLASYLHLKEFVGVACVVSLGQYFVASYQFVFFLDFQYLLETALKGFRSPEFRHFLIILSFVLLPTNVILQNTFDEPCLSSIESPGELLDLAVSFLRHRFKSVQEMITSIHILASLVPLHLDVHL